jgi:hypothetical protein
VQTRLLLAPCRDRVWLSARRRPGKTPIRLSLLKRPFLRQLRLQFLVLPLVLRLAPPRKLARPESQRGRMRLESLYNKRLFGGRKINRRVRLNR